MLANVVGADADRAREVLVGRGLSVPNPVDVAVVSVLRRRRLSKTMTARRFAAAVDDLAAPRADRYAVLPFMARAYELTNVSAHDATYVALAEQLDSALITADRRRFGSTLRDRRDQRLMAGPVVEHEAKTQLSRIVSRVEAGEEIVISCGSHPVAKVVRLDSSERRSKRGSLRGKTTFSGSDCCVQESGVRSR